MDYGQPDLYVNAYRFKESAYLMVKFRGHCGLVDMVLCLTFMCCRLKSIDIPISHSVQEKLYKSEEAMIKYVLVN